MESLRTPEIPLFITGVMGGLILLEYYVPFEALSSSTNWVISWVTAIFAVAPLLGLVKLWRIHYDKIRTREKGHWYHSIWVFILSIFFTIMGARYGVANRWVEWFYWNLCGKLYISSTCLQSLFLTSAAYRAFRARTREATIMMLGTIIILLTYNPTLTFYIPALKPIGAWMVQNPQLGVQRGITIGTGVGAIAIGFRILLGKEKAFAFGAEAAAGAEGGI
jgi:hypothetical protein